MPNWVKYAAAGLVVGLALFVAADAVVSGRDHLAADRGLAAMTEWRPEDQAEFECLIDAIERDGNRFGVVGDFELVPPSGDSDVIVLRSEDGIREFQLGERTLAFRGFTDSSLVFFECD
ncbi:MAG: hypothetical protein KJ698_04425 [Actinobacteria bacterium]|jgi:hypothetical protein|nr:hypothetical protein [Actinomycetota bacterium]MBU1492761.1 hypothetical protein [Actinomycetota bacterium]MBU1865134.1 hypothetical protein [Actinomycetota bacterium]